MKCPKCGSEHIGNAVEGMGFCLDCGYKWTFDQQSEIDRLRGVLREIDVNSHSGVMDVSTFHEALNYLRSINAIAKKGVGDE